MLIGLLTVLCEDDILPETLPLHEAMCDVIYRCDEPGVDGIRGRLLDQAYAEHGYDHWFLLLHADEVWRCNPDAIIHAHPDVDGFEFRLPFYVPLEPWDEARGVLEQLRWRLEPGWPEFRMFHGSPDVRYHPGQHFNTVPAGLGRIVQTDAVIDHYPYRSPAAQQARAAVTWDPDNYRRLPGDGVFTKAMLRQILKSPHYDRLTHPCYPEMAR